MLIVQCQQLCILIKYWSVLTFESLEPHILFANDQFCRFPIFREPFKLKEKKAIEIIYS